MKLFAFVRRYCILFFAVLEYCRIMSDYINLDMRFRFAIAGGVYE